MDRTIWDFISEIFNHNYGNDSLARDVQNYFSTDVLLGFVISSYCYDDFDYILDWVDNDFEKAAYITNYYNTHCDGDILIPENEEEDF